MYGFVIHINELCLIVKDDSTNINRQKENEKSHRFCKIKRGVSPTHLPTQKHHI